MSSKQLVLFDGNEDRMKVFDDIKQLTKLPSNCRFFIFCNEPENLQVKILSESINISGVYVRSLTNVQGIEYFLNNEIENYSFILIICGTNPSYSQIFPKIWKQYGRGKLFVKKLNNSSIIDFKDILNILKQHQIKSNNNTEITIQYSCIHCGQIFYSNNHLREHIHLNHSQNQTINKYIDSTTNISSHKKTNEPVMVFMQSGLSCSLCNEDFNNRQDFKNHMRQIHRFDGEDQ